MSQEHGGTRPRIAVSLDGLEFAHIRRKHMIWLGLVGLGSILLVDLVAPVALCRLAAPFLGSSRRGKIINISGGGATGPRVNFSAYASAKAALVRFSETLAEEARYVGVMNAGDVGRHGH